MTERITDEQIQRRLDALDAWSAGRSPQPDAYDDEWEYDILSNLRDARARVRELEEATEYNRGQIVIADAKYNALRDAVGEMVVVFDSKSGIPTPEQTEASVALAFGRLDGWMIRMRGEIDKLKQLTEGRGSSSENCAASETSTEGGEKEDAQSNADAGLVGTPTTPEIAVKPHRPALDCIVCYKRVSECICKGKAE